MTPRDRLLAAICHEEADRVPVCPRIWAFLAGYYGCRCWMHHMKAAREFDFDPFIILHSFTPNYLLYPFGSYKELDGVSVKLDVDRSPDFIVVSRRVQTPAGTLTDKSKLAFSPIYGISPTPVKMEYLVKTEEDLEKIPYMLPDPAKYAFQEDARSITRPIVDYHEVENTIGERGLVEVTVNGPLDHKDIYPLKDMMIAYYKDKSFLMKLLHMLNEHTMKETKAYLDAGVKIIFGVWYYESLSTGWSPKMYRELFLPLLKENVKLIHSYGALYHHYDDGKCMPIIGMLKDAKIDILSTLTPPPVGDVDLAKVKTKIGDQICLKGYVDLWKIRQGSPEDIEETVKEAISIAAPGGGFILGTSDSIREGTPVENVRAYFKAARKYGKQH